VPELPSCLSRHWEFKLLLHTREFNLSHMGHFIIIQPKFLKFETIWFRISFLFSYVCSYKFLGIFTPILQKLIERFLFITAFVFLPLDGICTDEQQKKLTLDLIVQS